MASPSHADEHSKTQSNSDRSENNNSETSRTIGGAGQPLVSETGTGNSSANASKNARLISDHPVPVLPEELCKAVHDQLNPMETLSELSRHQLIELSRIAKYVEISSTSKVEFIWSSVLQLAGLLFVVVFGVFAALAYNAANVANKQSFEANQLSLLTFCMSNPNSTGGICFAAAREGLGAPNSLATAILGPSSTPTTVFSASTPPPTSTSTVASFSVSNSSVTSVPVLTKTSTSLTTIPTTSTSTPVPIPTTSRHLSTPAIVGVVLGAVLLGASFCVSLCTWFVKFPRPRSSHLRGSPLRGLDGSGDYSDS